MANVNPAITHSPRNELTTADLAKWCRRAQSVTAQYRQRLDVINVIFDDDLDTGTNLNEMWLSVVDTTNLVVRQSPGLVTPSALLEAWGEDDDWDIVGRSTRIMRRVFRAMASAAQGRPALEPAGLADVLAAAATIPDWEMLLPEAGKQPRGPQPGTILDVVEAAADAAQSSRRAGLNAQLLSITVAAKKATDATPSHHKVLRATGVVDAGALGLSLALQELPDILKIARR